MLPSSVIKTAMQTLQGADGLFFFSILQSSSFTGLSGPAHEMITILIKDTLGLCKSQDSLMSSDSLPERVL